MDPTVLRLVPLILSLGLDTFTVSTAIGVAPLPWAARLRLAGLFALAEGLMPAVGLLIGTIVGRVAGAVDAYVAAGLLIATGLYLAREAWEDDDDEGPERLAAAAGRAGWPLVALAVSVSIDELAVGVSFGVLKLPLTPTLIAIAAQAACVSLFGLWLGQRIGRAIGERAQFIAAAVLILLGLAIGLAHLAGKNY